MDEKKLISEQNNESALNYSDNEGVSMPLEIPQEVRKITTQAYDKSVSDLVRMMEDKDIVLDPEFQRNYVWDNTKASLLIESIILNVPIPIIYVSQEADDTWTVIDGLQRLFSLKRFFEGRFKLSGLEVLSDLNAQDIHTLNLKALRMLRNGLLRIIMITHDSNESIKYDVFMRLNTGSVHLTEQELRNCLYRGNFNKLLKEIVENKEWQQLLGLKTPHKRMSDRELALRFFAINDSWNNESSCVEGYKGRMKNFLNDYMCEHMNASQLWINQKKDLFDATVHNVVTIMGEGAFRKLELNGVQERAINRAIMDVLMCSFSRYNLITLEKKKEEIIQAFYENIAANVQFRNSILVATSDTKSLNNRMQMWLRDLENLINMQ